ncbi:MAG: GNAT family N-acetyltransferase, partial [Clostridiales bacterium]|nr:GNAT family N-acetyltransferase [Clostridiales bacterium]
MKYNKTIILKDQSQCLLRNADRDDGKAVFDVFNLTHGQTDYLLSYPDENSFSVEQESEFLAKKTESDN